MNSTTVEPRFNAEKLLATIEGVHGRAITGRVIEATGLVIKAVVPGVRIGELCHITGPLPAAPLPAEVVGFKNSTAYLMALGPPDGIGVESTVIPTGRALTVPVGEALLGRVLDGLGRPIDGRGPLTPTTYYPVQAPPPDPLARPRITQTLTTGIRAIDAMLTLGIGQRIGIFAAAGGGKSTLLGMLARNTSADVNVIALVGERGREVRDFIEDSLGPEGLARSILVVATSDTPSLVRLQSARVATAIAEYFRDRGHTVILMMDSVTRYARALREVGLAIGEPPARAGFPPSVFAALPRLMERAGCADSGSITAIYTVLVEGDDMTEPVADEVRAILDGHIVLSRDLAARGHFPAIDICRSASRIMPAVTPPDQRRAAARLRELIAAYEQQRDLILLGAYQSGSDPTVDAAIERMPAITAFLQQRPDQRSPLAETRAQLHHLVGDLL